MSIEILRQDLRKLKGSVGQMLKNALPDLNNISDFSPNQLYHKDTVVCVKEGNDYKLYKCGYNNVKGELNPDSWSLHVVYAAINSKLGLYTKKEQLKFICPTDNTRRIKIDKHNFDPELNVLDIFVGGTIVDAENYIIEDGYIVLKDHVRGYARNREIIINMYGE